MDLRPFCDQVREMPDDDDGPKNMASVNNTELILRQSIVFMYFQMAFTNPSLF